MALDVGVLGGYRVYVRVLRGGSRGPSAFRGSPGRLWLGKLWSRALQPSPPSWRRLGLHGVSRPAGEGTTRPVGTVPPGIPRRRSASAHGRWTLRLKLSRSVRRHAPPPRLARGAALRDGLGAVCVCLSLAAHGSRQAHGEICSERCFYESGQVGWGGQKEFTRECGRCRLGDLVRARPAAAIAGSPCREIEITCRHTRCVHVQVSHNRRPGRKLVSLMYCKGNYGYM